MKLILLCVAVAMGSLIHLHQALAIVEARVTYGALSSSPDLAKVDVSSGASAIPSAAANYGVGADLLIIVPFLGLGGGLRYENMGFKINSNGFAYKTTTTRTSLLLNYRLIDTLLYLGPIFSYGISHSNNMTASYANNAADMSPDSASSYTAGLEVGAKLGGFILGAEMGYQSFKWDKMTDKNNFITTTPDLDMSGSYFKIALGFGI